MFASARQLSTTAGGADTRTPSLKSALPDRLTPTVAASRRARRTPPPRRGTGGDAECLTIAAVPHVSNTPSYYRQAHRAHRTGEADELG
jgi:hypothetical protein